MKWIKLYENFRELIVYKGVSPDFDPTKEGPMFFTPKLDLALYYGREVFGGGITKWRINFNNPLIVNALASAPIPLYSDGGSIEVLELGPWLWTKWLNS